MPQGELLVERRKYPRWDVSIDVSYKVIKGEKQNFLNALFAKKEQIITKNISGGGAMLCTGSGVKPGDLLDITMHLKSTDSTVRVTAEVIRVYDDVAGVKFLKIETESDEILQDIIKQKMRYPLKANITHEEALMLAQREYFLKMLDEELRSRGL